MRRIFIMIAILTLAGCAEKSRFDCPYGSGPSCLSMSEIDKNIKTNTNSNVKMSASCSKSACGKKAGNKTGNKTASNIATLPMHADAKPATRIPETVLQMWVSPYEANTGIYYQASFVNIIVKDAVWQAPVLDDASTREAYNG